MPKTMAEIGVGAADATFERLTEIMRVLQDDLGHLGECEALAEDASQITDAKVQVLTRMSVLSTETEGAWRHLLSLWTMAKSTLTKNQKDLCKEAFIAGVDARYEHDYEDHRGEDVDHRGEALAHWWTTCDPSEDTDDCEDDIAAAFILGWGGTGKGGHK